jgi:putative transposase
MSMADTREKLELWHRDYNEVRPHGAIGNKVPISLLNPFGETSPPGVKKAENSNVG